MKRKRFHNRSRGYLMIDLMIVMTMTMIILSISSVWVYKTMRYSTDVSQRESHSCNISRISRQLRTDVRDATSIIVADDLLTINIPNANNIEYSIDTHSVYRRNADGEKTHHDQFKFSPNAKLEWVFQEDSDSVALNVRRDFSSFSTSKDMTPKRLDAQIRIRANSELQE